MGPDLAVSKITAAAHQMDKLFISPKDRALGGKRLPLSLSAGIQDMLDDLDPQNGFWDSMKSCAWIAEAIQKARAAYSSSEAVLPPQFEIEGILAKSPNPIEGMIRFGYCIKEIQLNVHESESHTDRVNAVLKEAAKLAAKVGKKLAGLPQAAADKISGINRGGFDQYGQPHCLRTPFSKNVEGIRPK